MKCWKCGQQITEGAMECVYCHADQRRSVPQTPVGRALRQLYDHYGAEKALTNPVLLSNGLGDVVPDSLGLNVRKLKSQIRMAMDAGLGRLYLEQIGIGKPDGSFDARVRTILTEDAELNEKAAADLAGYFDEMIGWCPSRSAQDTEVQRKETAYQKACQKMNSGGVSDLREALGIFQNISGYRDADRLAVMCAERLENPGKEEIYQKALVQMNGASGRPEYENAIDLFGKIPGYKDADTLRKKCQEKLNTIDAEKKPTGKDGNGNKKWLPLAGILAAAAVLFLVLNLNSQINSRNQLHKEMTAMQQAFSATQTKMAQPTATRIPTKTPVMTPTRILTKTPVLTPTIPLSGYYRQNGWWIEDGVLRQYEGNDPVVIIPDGITKIESAAFYQKRDMVTSITIPDSVVTIDESAFSRCTKLTSITIPNSVTSIGVWAFKGCSSLTSITIPNSVTSIGDWAFEDCTGLKHVTMSNNITSIGTSVFNGCSSLTSITIPNSVTSIGDWAFSGCLNLTSITIPNSVTSIGDYAFQDCSSLTSITIPNSVTSIGKGAFSDCRSLRTVSLPNGLNKINEYLFRNCSDLKSVTLPNGVTSIGDSAFYSCSSLSSINIPGNVTYIGSSAFEDCVSLYEITIPASVKGFGSFPFYSTSMKVRVPKNSYAEKWCKENNRSYEKWNCVVY